jgi:hypothetical protein
VSPEEGLPLVLLVTVPVMEAAWAITPDSSKLKKTNWGRNPRNFMFIQQS